MTAEDILGYVWNGGIVALALLFLRVTAWGKLKTLFDNQEAELLWQKSSTQLHLETIKVIRLNLLYVRAVHEQISVISTQHPEISNEILRIDRELMAELSNGRHKT